MRSLGIDIGSRTIKVAVLEDGHLEFSQKADSSYDPMSVAHKLLQGLKYDTMTATGYGRHNLKSHFGCPVISEIKAFGQGARFFFPEAAAVLDIGGQDTKTIALDAYGRVSKFEMNDRCAAGTGRFMEIMANALHYTMDEFGSVACTAQTAEKISSMCTVFAESEVVSLISSGAGREAVALGIHEAIASRIAAMASRIGLAEPVMMTGGVARNLGVVRALEKAIGMQVVVSPHAQVNGAIGAAAIARDV